MNDSIRDVLLMIEEIEKIETAPLSGIIDNLVDTPKDFSEIIDKNFWDLL